MTPKPTRPAAFAMLTAAVAFWGASFPVTHYALGFFPPFTLAFLRFVSAAAILAAVIRPSALPPRGERKALFLLGVTGAFLFASLMNLGMGTTTGIAGSLLSATPPILTAVLAAWFLGEPLRRGRAAGLALGIAGIALVIRPPAGAGDGFTAAAFAGNAIFLLSQVSWAVYTMLGRRFALRETGESAALWTTAVGAALLLPFAGAEILGGARVRVTAGGLCSFLYLAVFTTALAYIFWNRALRTVGASSAAGFQYFQPLFGALVAVEVFGESPSLSLAAGAALILGGVWCVLRGDTGNGV